MPERPWQVLYNDEGRWRSKSFTGEDEAYAWAAGRVRAEPGRQAWVHHRDTNESDPVPVQFRMAWQNDEPVVMIWPVMSRADYERWNRRMLEVSWQAVSVEDAPDNYAGPLWQRLVDQPLRALPARR